MWTRSRLKYFLIKFIYSATFLGLASFFICFSILVQSHPQLLLKQLKTECNKHQNLIKFCLIWLIIILNLYHLYRIYMKTQKRESVFRHRFSCLVTLISPVRNRVCTNPDAVPATQQKHVFSDSLYLVPLFPLGSIRTMFLI